MTPIEELIKAIREDGTRSLDGDLEVNLGAYDLDAYIRMNNEMLDQLKAKHKEDVINFGKEYGTFLIMCEREGRPLLEAKDYFEQYYLDNHKQNKDG